MKNNLHKIIVLLLLCILTNSAFCQNQDTARINQLIANAKKILYQSPDNVLLYSDTIIQESSNAGYTMGLYTGNNLRGIAWYFKNNLEESILSYKNAISYVHDTVPENKIKLHRNIGISYRQLSMHDSAIFYFDKAYRGAAEYEKFDLYESTVLDLAYLHMKNNDYVSAYKYISDVLKHIEISENKLFQISAHGAIGLFYTNVLKNDLSHSYYKKAISLDLLDNEYNMLGETYCNYGQLFLDNKEYDSAIYYYHKAINEGSPLRKDIVEIKTCINIGNTYLRKPDLDSAAFYYIKVRNHPLYKYFPEVQAAVSTNLGTLNYRKGNLKQAHELLTKGLKLSEDHGLLQFQMNAHSLISKIDSINGKANSALYHYKKQVQFNDSINKRNAIKEIARHEFEKYQVKRKYDNELLIKENTVQTQKITNQRIVIFLIIIIVLVLLIVVYQIFRGRRKTQILNKELKNTNSELKKLNSDLNHQKQEMKELLMSKDRFVSLLGHDLKNPFNSLLGFLETFDKNWDDYDDGMKKETIGNLYTITLNTYQLLEELIDWGITQRGLINTTMTKIQVIKIFQEVTNILQLQSKEKGISMDIQAPHDLHIKTDRKLLSHILQNFVSNAIKFSHPDSVVVLSATEKNDHIEICVTDQGIGIPEDKIDHLFRLDKNFSRKGTKNEKSTGMGLLLCKEYADIINSKITIKSQPQKGSTFCLQIAKSE